MKLLFALILVASTGTSVHAERLAIRFVGPAEGLPHSRVRAVVEDDRGFLWFATPEGLGRFDGSAMRVYDKRDGLPVAGVNDLLVTRGGDYLLATGGSGVWRIDPQGSLSPLAMGNDGAAPTILALHEDDDGRVWAGAERGLFVLDVHAGESSFAEVPGPDGLEDEQVLCFLDDPDGSLWIGTSSGLMRRLPDGSLIRYTIRGFGQPTRVRSLEFDNETRLWIGHEYGLLVYARRVLGGPASETDFDSVIQPRHVDLGNLDRRVDLPDGPGESAAYTAGDDLNRRPVRRVYRSSDGRIWIAQVGRGLLVFDGQFLTRYDKSHGLRDDTLNDILEDRAGGFWLASDAGGAMRVDWDGLTSFGNTEGLGHTFVTALYEDRQGAPIAVAGNFHVNVFNGRAFESVTRALPADIGDPAFWENGLLMRNGEWWLPTTNGLYRFARTDESLAIGSAAPTMIYGPGQGLPGTTIGAMYEDRDGDLWLSVLDGGAPLARWDSAADRFHLYTERDGLPGATITALTESPSGELWVGFENGRIARRRGTAGFELIPTGTGTPLAPVYQLLFDSVGRLWIATDGGGLGRVDDPRTGDLSGRTYSAADGLASESVRCLVEDRFGRIYAGTGRGIHRVSPDDHRIARLAAEGLTNDEVRVAYRDRHDDLWFGMLDGLSRLRPREERKTAPPAVFIGALIVDGSRWPIAELGASEMETIELPPGGSHLQIDYFALPFVSGDTVHYEYRLNGAGDRWIAAGKRRSVVFANLAPGHYEFQVRATDSGGAVTPQPAGFRLIVRPPFWRTPWFAGLVLALAAAAGWVLHRNRVARALAVERVRTRIATDLHDDIGSNLSHMAILSEVTLSRLGDSGARATESLSRIAEVSRETIDTMGDIVWAINPERDQLGDLVLRMRRFTNDMFSARPIRISFAAPTDGLDKRLDSDTKRQLYRVFKESLHNAVKHSGCTEIRVELVTEGGRLRLAVRDDGQGFDPETVAVGHGLDSMSRRAADLGGRLEIRATVGQGTEIILDVPRDRSPT